MATFNPVAGANSPCDGEVRESTGSGSTWASLIGTATGISASATGTSFAVKTVSYNVSNQFTDIWRCIMNFDTSSITAGATITAATLSLYVNAGYNYGVGLGDTSVHAVSATPASTANVVNGDLSQLGSTSFGNFASINALSGGSYNIMTLNASGIAAINKTGITSLGLKLGWDIAGSFTGTWGSFLFTGAGFFTADQGTNFAPVLTVTYSKGNTSSFLAFM